MENKKDGLIKLTGLWEKKGKTGVYLQGKLSYFADILIFENQYKSNIKDPDYFLYFARRGKKEESEVSEDVQPF